MKRWLVSLLTILQLVFISSVWAAPQIPPKPQNNIYVQDYAKVLSSDTVKTITNISQQLNAKTKAQIIVVTIPSLNSTPLEDYSLTLFRTWGIGDKNTNNGVLLLVAVNDRQSRIEVGYGLEGALPDGKTGRIQDQFMLPYFTSGKYDMGILQGYLQLATEVAGEYNMQLPDSTKSMIQQPTTDQLTTLQKALFGIGLLVLLLLDHFFLGGMLLNFLLIMFMRGGGGRGGSQGGGFGGGSAGGGGSSRKW